jgi:hypothetical protein
LVGHGVQPPLAARSLQLAARGRAAAHQPLAPSGDQDVFISRSSEAKGTLGPIVELDRGPAVRGFAHDAFMRRDSDKDVGH